MEPLEQLLHQNHLIIGQKFEIMLDIISIFWVIWLDKKKLGGKVKITIDYRAKKSLKNRKMLNIIGAF